MVREGATTLWERWEYLSGRGMNSHNHIMFGSIDAWFYKAICGVEPDLASPGFRHYFISPNYFNGLKSASCSFQSVSGKIATSWDRIMEGKFNLRASIPANTTCTIRIPTSGFRNWLLRESSRNVISSSGARTNEKVPRGILETIVEQESIVCRVGSGNYNFVLNEQSSASG
jgi:alpha-L-rhamnosidase